MLLRLLLNELLMIFQFMVLGAVEQGYHLDTEFVASPDAMQGHGSNCAGSQGHFPYCIVPRVHE